MNHNKKTLTISQDAYITENYQNMSMNDLAKRLGISYNRVRNFMIEQNLKVSKAQAQAFRIAKMKTETKEHKEEPYKPPNNRWYYDAYAAK